MDYSLETEEILNARITMEFKDGLSETISSFGEFLRFMHRVSKMYHTKMIYDHEILSKWNQDNSMDLLFELSYKMGFYDDMPNAWFLRILAGYLSNLKSVMPIIKKMSSDPKVQGELLKYVKSHMELMSESFDEFIDPNEYLNIILFKCQNADEMQDILINYNQV